MIDFIYLFNHTNNVHVKNNTQLKITLIYLDVNLNKHLL